MSLDVDCSLARGSFNELRRFSKNALSGCCTLLEFEVMDEKDMDKREFSFSMDLMCSTFRLLFVAGVDESGILWVVTMSVPSSMSEKSGN